MIVTEPTISPAALLPHHALRIEASGIKPEVAAARGYRSISTRGELRALGFGDAQSRTAPGLLCPVYGPSGDLVFYSFRPDHPRVKDGRVLKYETPYKARMALDVHPDIRAKLGDPAVPLFITEGSRKADSAISVGLCCVALIGVWNWRGTNELGGTTALADWEMVALKGRQIYIVFDSDVTLKPEVHGAMERLKGFLESRGAKVATIYLPPGEGGAKVGLDDYLASGHDVKDLMLNARSTLLPAPNGERAREQKPTQHPWLSVEEVGIRVGRATDDGGHQVVTSAGELEKAPESDDEHDPGVRVYPDLVGRWPDADAEDWLSTKAAPQFSEVLAALIHIISETCEFTKPEHSSLVAVWAVASYFHRLYLTFPRLQLVGERGSGKTKVMGVLQGAALNAWLLIDVTPAVLFRLIQETRPTLLLDEAEALGGEEKHEVSAILNAGYKRGGAVPRCEETDGKRSVEFYDIYSPAAVASIKGLGATTEDRSITLVMAKGTDTARINSEVDPRGPAFVPIRSGCYRLLLTRWKEVAEEYQNVEMPAWLTARPRELWRPLLAIAAVADREPGGLELTKDLLVLAKAHVNDQSDASEEMEALLAVLAARLGPTASEITVLPGDLSEPLRDRLKWKTAPSGARVGSWLRRGLFKRLQHTDQGNPYEITRVSLAKAAERFRSPEVE